MSEEVEGIMKGLEITGGQCAHLRSESDACMQWF